MQPAPPIPRSSVMAAPTVGSDRFALRSGTCVWARHEIEEGFESGAVSAYPDQARR